VAERDLDIYRGMRVVHLDKGVPIPDAHVPELPCKLENASKVRSRDGHKIPIGALFERAWGIGRSLSHQSRKRAARTLPLGDWLGQDLAIAQRREELRALGRFEWHSPTTRPLDAEKSVRAYAANMAFDVAWITSSGFASPGAINPAIHRPVRGHKPDFTRIARKTWPPAARTTAKVIFAALQKPSAANRQFCGARGKWIAYAAEYQ
jgi:hypothetical protein